MSPKDEKEWNEMIAGYANEILDVVEEGRKDNYEPMSGVCMILRDMADKIKTNWN